MARARPTSEDEATILRALKKLAGRNMVATKMASGGVTLLDYRDAGVIDCGEMAAATWAVLERRGWVVEENESWRLSNAGRIQLKRLLSRGETGRPSAEAGRAAERCRQASPEVQIDLAESPLSWLRRRSDRQGRPLISQAQFEAGERLRADFERGHMGPRLTTNWSGVGGVSPGSARPDYEIELHAQAIAARERVRAALAAVGPELSGILVDVCCHLKGLADVERSCGWPQRTAKVVLLMALTMLARHYGLVRTADEERGHVRHWGAEDYRPTLSSRAAG